MIDQNQLTPEEEKAGTVNVGEDAKGLFKSVSVFLSDLFDIRDETDREQTIEGIKADIPFKGHIAWILIFAVFIASIGLNVSSTAVVIGAMLISPLMGPILGIGMSLAIFDMQTLKRSLVNLGVMVGLSVFTAFLYFLLSPLTEETPELLARTKPHILDVLVAIFGGLALIVAKSKKGTMASVIFGVAIATALMPPLCTVGYGLSVAVDESFLKGLRYAGGAMYLFSINTIFIALSTFVVAKALRFPLVKYANAEKRNRIKWTVTGIALLAILPAIVIFMNVLEESHYERDIKDYVKREVVINEDLFLSRYEKDYEEKTITLVFMNELTDATRSDLTNEVKNYKYIKDFKVIFKGSKVKSVDVITKAYDEALERIDEKEELVKSLQARIESLKEELSEKVESRDYLQLSKDAKIEFSELTELSFATELKSNFKKLDTLSVARPVWKTELIDSIVRQKNTKLSLWLQKQMRVDTVYVK